MAKTMKGCGNSYESQANLGLDSSDDGLWWDAIQAL